MRLRPTLLALAVSLAAAGTSAAAQTATPAAPAAPAAPHPTTAVQPAVKPTPAATAKAVTSAKPTTAAPAVKAEPVDINTATSADLKAIPGIGDAYAAKIIANRPYHSKDELTRKKVLPAGVYAKVKDHVIARQH